MKPRLFQPHSNYILINGSNRNSEGQQFVRYALSYPHETTISHARPVVGITPTTSLSMARPFNLRDYIYPQLSELARLIKQLVILLLRVSECFRCQHLSPPKVNPRPGFSGRHHFCTTPTTPKTRREVR